MRSRTTRGRGVTRGGSSGRGEPRVTIESDPNCTGRADPDREDSGAATLDTTVAGEQPRRGGSLQAAGPDQGEDLQRDLQGPDHQGQDLGTGSARGEERNIGNSELLRLFREELRESLQSTSDQISDRFKGKIEHLERKVEIAKKPEFKSKANGIHFDRSQRYLEFILDARTAICEEDTREAIVILDALAEAVKSFQKDVTLADKYESGWQLVSRVKGEDEEDTELRKLDQKIMDEKFKKRKREPQTRPSANIPGFSSYNHSGYPTQPFNQWQNGVPYGSSYRGSEGAGAWHPQPATGWTAPRPYSGGASAIPATTAQSGAQGNQGPRKVFQGDCHWCNAPGHSFKVVLRL